MDSPARAPASESRQASPRARSPAFQRRLLELLPPADWASLLCFALISIVMLATLRDYGFTYDEEMHIRDGERILAFYTGVHGLSPALAQSSYGPGFDVVAALLRRISPWDAFRTNHWLCVFVAQLGLLGTWRLGRFIAGPAGGLLALLFLVLTPVYYGHQFNNPKDLPFAAGYVWGLYFIARLTRRAPGSAQPHASAEASEGPDPEAAVGIRYWVGLALSLALGMLVRVGGAVLIAYLVALLSALALEFWRLEGR
ncbi:MAG TPA: hypothetical protein VG963_06630, partial [Polyangiaceae bacterium]|nr:hypothetical protein [Polyangiaceae bacterium]